MSRNRNISALKVMRALFSLTVLVLAYLAFSSSARIYRQQPISGMEVRILNPELGFVRPDAVQGQLIERRGLSFDSLPRAEVDIHQMERILLSNPWIASANVYISPRHRIQVEIRQREPLIRVWDEENHSLYLDEDAQRMPLSADYSHYGVVITYEGKAEDLDTADWASMVRIGRFLKADSFWNAQAAQLIYRPDGEFEIIPVLGSQRILIGKAERLEEKFGNLMLFYDQVLQDIGWDQYKVLDLRFRGQVVASPPLETRARKQAAPSPSPSPSNMASTTPEEERPQQAEDDLAVDDGEDSEAGTLPGRLLPPQEAPVPAKPPDRRPDTKREEPQPKYIYNPEAQ